MVKPTPLKHINQNWIISPGRGENRKYLSCHHRSMLFFFGGGGGGGNRLARPQLFGPRSQLRIHDLITHKTSGFAFTPWQHQPAGWNVFGRAYQGVDRYLISLILFLGLDPWPLDPLDPPKSFKGLLFLIFILATGSQRFQIYWGTGRWDLGWHDSTYWGDINQQLYIYFRMPLLGANPIFYDQCFFWQNKTISLVNSDLDLVMVAYIHYM